MIIPKKQSIQSKLIYINFHNIYNKGLKFLKSLKILGDNYV